MGFRHKISDENIGHIIKVFLAGNKDYKLNINGVELPNIICDSAPGEERDTYCEWKDVLKYRKILLAHMKEVKGCPEITELAAALEKLWGKRCFER